MALQTLYHKPGATWVAAHHQVGATDVWFLWRPFCLEYRAVIGGDCELN
jgi:hypothetical protein